MITSFLFRRRAFLLVPAWLALACLAGGCHSSVSMSAMASGMHMQEDDPQNDVPVSISVVSPNEVEANGTDIVIVTVVLEQEAKHACGQIVHFEVTEQDDVIVESIGTIIILKDKQVGEIPLTTKNVIGLSADTVVLVDVWSHNKPKNNHYVSFTVTPP